MAKRFGIIISVEKYNSGLMGLPSVKYANADARSMRTVFKDQLGILDEDIIEYTNESFTCNTPLEIKYYIKHLSVEYTEVYVYYAGHGFFSNGTNYLTAYDTSSLDIITTSISFEDLFLNSFKDSPAKKCIAFIDACAEGLTENTRAVGIRGFNYRLFDDAYNRLGFSYSVYFSCSPEEKSFSSDKLGHGVWTWHLCQALSGLDKRSFGTTEGVTLNSLKEYLTLSVSTYNKTSNEGLGIQTPYALIASNEDWILWEPSKKAPSFEKIIEELVEQFFNSCHCANLEFGGYEEDSVIDNYSVATDVCWDAIAKGYEFPENWEDALAKLMYYSSKINDGKRIDLRYEEQLEEIGVIRRFVDSIPYEF